MTVEPVNMSEKKYLLTESDIRQIKDLECNRCVDNAGGHFNCADASKAKQYRFLEAHEYREHTCRNTPSNREFCCSECGTAAHLLIRDKAGGWQPVTPNRCPCCGAKVVSE